MKLHQFELTVIGAKEKEDGYVTLAHGQRYSLKLSSDFDGRCDVEISIDGNHVGIFRVEAGSSCVIERPVADDGFFTFYAIASREARLAGITSKDATGLITAIFMPEFKGIRLCSPVAPPPGGTGLSGHSKQRFTSASPLSYKDPDEFVTIHIRLGEAIDVRPLVKREMSTPIPPPLTQ